MILFTPQANEVIAAPWRDALITKLLGTNIGYSMMKQRLKPLWRLKGDFDIMNVGNGYFMAKFDLEEDRSRVMEGGPWMILDHYPAVKRWSLDFNPTEECFGKTMVWVRLAELNLSYYHKRALKAIAVGLGKLIKVDTATQLVGRGRFAHFCVEIDLAVPVHHEIWIRDHWHTVEYESLHLICSKCDCYGHPSRMCFKEVVVADTPSPKMMTSEKQVEPMVQTTQYMQPSDQGGLHGQIDPRIPSKSDGEHKNSKADTSETPIEDSTFLKDEEGWVKVESNKSKSKHVSSKKAVAKQKSISLGVQAHGLLAKQVHNSKNKKFGMSNQMHTKAAKTVNLSSKTDSPFTFNASKSHLVSLGSCSRHAQSKPVTSAFTAKKRQWPPSPVASPSLVEDEQQKPIVEGNMVDNFPINKVLTNSSLEGTIVAT